VKTWILANVGVAAILALIAASSAVAQDPFSPSVREFQPTTDSVEGSSGADAYVPLSPAQKYLYSVNQVFTGPVWIGFAMHAAFDQFRDTPNQWGRNAESFGMRMASHFGTSLLRETMAFGVREADHEDPRYFRAGHGSGWDRTKFALKRTFMVHNDSGGIMPAYSTFVANYATPFLVHQWRPERFTPADGFETGTLNVGIDAATNVWREFWPDVRKKLPSFVSKHLN
jgi:hypothetical protein